MFRIVLIRPGSTDYDTQGRIQGTLDIPLSDLGSQEVAQIVIELRNEGIEILYSPPSQPAWQTAQIIADELQLKLKRLDRMQNVDLGLWQGMLLEDVRRKQPRVYRLWQEQPDTICPPEGEMISDAVERVSTALAKLLKRHKEGVIGIVVPEPLASLVRCCVKHEVISELWKPGPEHSRWEILEVAPETALTPSG
jgi:probable phosphoglycerate mutase